MTFYIFNTLTTDVFTADVLFKIISANCFLKVFLINPVYLIKGLLVNLPDLFKVFLTDSMSLFKCFSINIVDLIEEVLIHPLYLFRTFLISSANSGAGRIMGVQMNSTLRNIFLPAAILGGIALVLGVVIAVVSKAFAVKADQLQEDVLAALPQANCGACGFSGCEGYAGWLAAGGDDLGKCPVGGSKLPLALGEILGKEASEIEPPVAHVMCKGTTEYTSNRFEYSGTQTCASANNLFSGPGSCTYGCLGLGDCAAVCAFGAIDIIDGAAIVNELKCKSCEKCVSACPKNLIFMIPKDNRTYKVQCRNHWPGKETRTHCKVGCIACQRCVKACIADAITMDNNVAVIDPDKCINCGECYRVCPTNSISNPDALYAHY